MNDSVRNATNKGKVNSFSRSATSSERARVKRMASSSAYAIFWVAVTNFFSASESQQACEVSEVNEKEQITFDPITFHVVEYFRRVFPSSSHSFSSEN